MILKAYKGSEFWSGYLYQDKSGKWFLEDRIRHYLGRQVQRKEITQEQAEKFVLSCQADGVVIQMANYIPKPCKVYEKGQMCQKIGLLEGYCEIHKDLAPSIRFRGRSPYASAHWRNFRVFYLKRHRICVDCESKGILRVATEIHHQIPIKNYPGSITDESNLEPLCHYCHSAKTFRAQQIDGLRPQAGSP